MTPVGSRRTPTPRITLSRERIVEVALALIDEIGLQAFSMRKLGAKLGADPMAVYRHLSDQEGLYDAIAERLFDQVDVDSLPWEDDWRVPIETYCHRLRDVLLEHPRAVTVFATRPIRSDNAIAAGERMMRRLTAAGFDAAEALALLRCVREFTVGHALSVAVSQLDGARRSRKPEPGAPNYNLLAEGADTAPADGHFASGLTALLDGFAHGSGRRPAGSTPSGQA